MTSYLVYRDCPGKPRQYIRRISHAWAVWNPDVTQAQRFSRREAELWALVMHRRSMTHRNGHPHSPEPAGVYDTQEAT
jgi:hypothetical protein